MIPEIVTAAADVVVAVENGVAMRRNNNPPGPPAAPPAPVMAGGISGEAFLIGMMILAFAILGAAVIVHHGLAA
jgi:hypothetical protein